MAVVDEALAWEEPERVWQLSEIDLFKDLSEAEMAEIARAAPMQSLPTGRVLFTPDEPREVLFILKKGRVRIYRVGRDGRTLTTALVTPGNIFGEMNLLGQRMEDSWAETLEPCVVCLMSRHDVQRLLLSDPRIAARIAEQLGDRVASLERRLSDTVMRTVPERVTSALAVMTGTERLESGRQSSVTLRLTHQQLADLVGTSREATTRVLGDLSDRGFLRLRRGRIVIMDPRGLRDLANPNQH